MIPFRKSAIAGLALAALGLGGCITVFPKAKAVQMYRFGDGFTSAVPAAGGATLNVMRSMTNFESAAAGDRILTSDGRETAYVAGARWVSPAAVLFDEAETRAFAATGGAVQLVGRGQAAQTPFSLKLNVETFEARYPGGAKGAPAVVVIVSAELTQLADRQLVSARTFEVRKPATDNRVGAIVEAFDDSTTEVLGNITRWVVTQGAPQAAKP